MDNLKGHPWNEEEINLILVGKFSDYQIAHITGRSYCAVQAKRRELKVLRANKSEKDDEKLIREAKELQIKMRAKQLGVKLLG